MFAGKTEIELDSALFKLHDILGIMTLLLESGSILNGGVSAG